VCLGWWAQAAASTPLSRSATLSFEDEPVGRHAERKLRNYQEAATTCPGLPWTVLAAIGTVESSNGTSDLPGVQSGANAAGAEGPMQVEPGTTRYDTPVPPGGESPPSPYDATDAVYAAARDLCANGADLTAAIYAYNHSNSYVTEVLNLAQSYGETEAQTVAAGAVGSVAVDWALAQVGTPYRWGAQRPGSPSTAAASLRLPTRSQASPSPASRRTSTTRQPSSDQMTPYSRETSCSSARAPATSPTLASPSNRA
jgi:cell wall-associated NlpC family hydrolase